MSTRQVGVALFCFGGKKAASTHQDALQEELRSAGDTVLQTTILQVNDKQKASVHDARRVVQGTLTAALTWGLFGLVAGTNKLESTVVWAAIGAICGGLYAYASEHVLTKSELERIGRSMHPNSSALVIYAETGDPTKLLAAAAPYTPSASSVAVIDADLVPRVLAGTSPIEVPHGSADGSSVFGRTTGLSMLLYRYPDPKTAAQVAKAVSKAKPSANRAPQIELVIETDRNGRRHVTDPTRGTAAWARSDVVSWGLFGVVFGAIAGATGGGGFHGAVTNAAVTGVAWAVFGAVAGALYGLWAGRSISARRLRGIGPILSPGTSSLLAWVEGAVRREALEALGRPEAQRLVLSFDPVPGGAVLEANELPEPRDRTGGEDT
jgi:uncharacterized membrane protein